MPDMKPEAVKQELMVMLQQAQKIIIEDMQTKLQDPSYVLGLLPLTLEYIENVKSLLRGHELQQSSQENNQEITAYTPFQNTVVVAAINDQPFSYYSSNNPIFFRRHSEPTITTNPNTTAQPLRRQSLGSNN